MVGKESKKLQVSSPFTVQAVFSPSAELSKSFTCEIKLDSKCLIICINRKGILSQTL